jgi:cell wall-associated NlpC family hydrolase
MFASRTRRLLAAALLSGLAVAGVAVPAQAAPGPPTGHLTTVRQNMFTHQLRIAGWAYDPARPRAAVQVRVFVDGSLVRSVRADDASDYADHAFGLTGPHGYSITLTRGVRARVVTAKSRGTQTSGPVRTLSTHSVLHYRPPAGERIIDVAKRFVGGRYVEGGASPAGFDCSGYTQYAYAHANVKRLIHNAEAQRRSMRPISRATARPGDLVFYMSGAAAYHVAIYAGHGWQYAAATVRDGVRYQPVWSCAVQYRTDWH